ncbi:MAG: FlgD immunoglobulin-like domain containing protein [Candidatus Eisenbacteria bacterium]
MNARAHASALLVLTALLAALVVPALAGPLGVVLPTKLVSPGATVDVPVEATGSPVGLGITSVDFRITLDPTWVQSVQLLPEGMVYAWNAPFASVSTSAITVAAAGGTPLASPSTRIATLRVVLKPGVPAGTDVWLTVERFLFNEQPSGGTTDGLIRVRVGNVGVDGSGLAYALAAPSPSPARTTARLAFELPAASRGAVTLAIHDVSGRRVRTLVHAALPAGRHALAWDLRDDAGERVRAGTYFVRLDCDAGTRTRRLAVLR